MHPLKQQFFDRFLLNVGVYITDADVFVRTAYTDQFFAGKLGCQHLLYFIQIDTDTEKLDNPLEPSGNIIVAVLVLTGQVARG
ncbi:hypothetical protein D3C72_1988620 [compost metagenome]